MSAPNVGQFNPLYGHQGNMVQNPMNNQLLLAQQQMLMQQRMNYNRQLSEGSQDSTLFDQYF